ncbi:MAG: HPr family phosphocarrier protein [Alphaproteobacteria bacterium]|nr:HPr family phosphocarrier protein [Alphaproteobacteria bacterium]MDE2630427.1 HPr family phosphocarrier protein [Alphaproteobacteria bacterium]
MSDAARLSAVARITNKRGLHARASAKLVEAASRFKAHITVSKDGHSVEARSIMGLMLLAASLGTDVELCAEGEDAQEALTAILALIAANFGEE